MMFSGHRLCFPVYSSSVMYPVTSSVTSFRRRLGHSCPSRAATAPSSVQQLATRCTIAILNILKLSVPIHSFLPCNASASSYVQLLATPSYAQLSARCCTCTILCVEVSAMYCNCAILSAAFIYLAFRWLNVKICIYEISFATFLVKDTKRRL